jgi:solute carrier family 25 folate transporter 32
LELAVASIFAKCVATVVTYPHEVIRSRLQDHRASGSTIRSVVNDMIAREGVRALWVGVRVNLFRVVPSTISTFLGYEYLTRYIKSYLNN